MSNIEIKVDEIKQLLASVKAIPPPLPHERTYIQTYKYVPTPDEARNIRVQWVATDLIHRPHAPNVRRLSGLRAVTPGYGYIGFNVLLMMFPTPNNPWSTHVLKRVTDLKIDCSVIFGGEVGHSDGHISILPVLEQSWEQKSREVFAHVHESVEKAIEMYERVQNGHV